MKLLKRIKSFLFINNTTKLLFLEAYLFLAWARFIKSKKFSKVASFLGTQMGETTLSLDKANYKVLRDISQSVHIMSKYTFWESMCLVRAIAAMKMLERRNIESTIYLGTAKDEAGKLIAHAWTRSGPFYITGAEEMDRFVIVSKFAKRIERK
ncbi:hypothetical protein F4694_000561 [Bacillus niacini]|uniref:Microcin J25-processing protein McjB C-terminal domain-containing protein n=1 Tax=Neobacillus niacini TaxID=86668 RepID=A0A852T560_9BACI|nr:lasso peptide biosynthesis B2 protein [Neobacillus niacini]NYE03842.1 hypothetical protein [Neobacillus niacini]